ncbi:Glyceraldehyde 3-phosphate dehydrogenase, NAD binding domain family protein [Leishmania donovani]|uniref:Glyceraldehyde 3-phosphate dehydrogenase, NAD binding domain family protein n=1 Tax=Leishmania donovani TaxID=5661 RepID=A0A504X4W5_LEIDO|nr:Glyceraldehyde 3-phosphate dehydrogenase, NAD binding domain family protein [Leishmania donovani]
MESRCRSSSSRRKPRNFEQADRGRVLLELSNGNVAAQYVLESAGALATRRTQLRESEAALKQRTVEDAKASRRKQESMQRGPLQLTRPDPLFTVTAVVDASVCAAYIAYVIEQEYPHRNPTGPPIRVTDKQKDQIVLNDIHAIHVSAAQDPQSSTWKKYGVQYVLECTGLYTTRSRSWVTADTNTVMASSDLERLAASLPVCAVGAPIGAVVAPVLDALAKVLEIEQVSYTALYGPQPQHPIGAKSDDSRDWRQVRLQPFASCAMASSRDNGAETRLRARRGGLEAAFKVCIANGPMISVDCIGSSSVILDAASLSSSTEGKVHRMVLWVDVACYYAALLLSLVKQAHSIHAPPSS